MSKLEKSLEPKYVFQLVQNNLKETRDRIELQHVVNVVRENCAHLLATYDDLDSKRRIPHGKDILIMPEFPEQIVHLLDHSDPTVRFFTWAALYRPSFFESGILNSFFEMYIKAEKLFQSEIYKVLDVRELAYLIDAQTSWRGLGEGFGRCYSEIKENLLDDLGCSLEDYRERFLVDLGCSHSDFVDKVARYHVINSFGVDVAFHETFAVWSAYKTPIKFNDALKIKRINLQRRIAGSMTNLSLGDNSVDCYVSHQSIHYLPDNYYNLAFKEIVRTLAPEGDAFIFPVREGVESLLENLGISNRNIKSKFAGSQGRVHFKK